MTNTIDLCFVLDCSSSMGHNIDKIQPQLNKLVKTLRLELLKKRKDCDMRMSCVLFRDHDSKTRRLESMNFTESMQEFRDRISKIETVGGSDVPEDVLGGLDLALSLDWRGTRRFLIFVGDAPCHGTKYHGLEDSYPEGDPHGLTPEVVLAKMREKLIHFLFVKLSGDTNKMVEMFRPMYEDKAKGLEIEVMDCRKEAKSHVKEKLEKIILSKINIPCSLMYLATRTVKMQPNYQDYLGLLPLEVQEYIEEMPEEQSAVAGDSAQLSGGKGEETVGNIIAARVGFSFLPPPPGALPTTTVEVSL